MPLYEYICRKCRYKFEEHKKFSDRNKQLCPKCKSKCDVKISLTNFSVKGDNAKNSYGLKK